jgi:hypothetical protein
MNRKEKERSSRQRTGNGEAFVIYFFIRTRFLPPSLNSMRGPLYEYKNLHYAWHSSHVASRTCSSIIPKVKSLLHLPLANHQMHDAKAPLFFKFRKGRKKLRLLQEGSSKK